MNDSANQTDDQLIAQVQNGDFDAFRMIVHRYSNALLSVAYSIIGDYHEAQDATQEAFVKSYNQLGTLKDPSRLGSWLYAIVYRTSLDAVKKKKATLPYDDAKATPSDNVHAWLEQHAVQESVWHALRTLEDTSRAAVALRYLSDWSMKDIGLFLNLSVSAVESRIRRARESLRLHLAGDFEAYFRPYRLGREFEQAVCEQALRRAGHFYIPVTDRQRSADWFSLHFQLGESTHGNLQLESGQQLYLLECRDYSPRTNPLLSFSVSDIDDLWFRLNHNGVRTESIIEEDELFGKLFVFYDPDANKFHAVQTN